jgi:hypothetical protein
MRVRCDNPLVRPCVAARALASSVSSRDALDSEVAVAQRDCGGDLQPVHGGESARGGWGRAERRPLGASTLWDDVTGRKFVSVFKNRHVPDMVLPGGRCIPPSSSPPSPSYK